MYKSGRTWNGYAPNARWQPCRPELGAVLPRNNSLCKVRGNPKGRNLTLGPIGFQDHRPYPASNSTFRGRQALASSLRNGELGQILCTIYGSKIDAHSLENIETVQKRRKWMGQEEVKLWDHAGPEYCP